MEFAYIGSYTTPKRGGLGYGGISVFSRETPDAPWKEVQVWEGKNPSFLTMNPAEDRLYAVEADGDSVTAFSVDERSGRLERMNICHTGFNNGVHLQTDNEGKFLFVASAFHESGALTVIRLNEDGSLGQICDSVEPEGSLGPLTRIQSCSQPHQIKFDRQGRYQLEANRGQDCVHTWQTDPTTGKLTLVSTMMWRPGSCPRHLAFHPDKPFAFLVTEWFGTVVSCHYEDGILTPLACVSTIPETFLGMKNSAAEIEVHPNGKFLYVSNREHSSICAYRIEDDGCLITIGWCTEGVEKPRFFAISPDGSSIYCANEKGHNVTQYAIDLESGALTFTTEVMCASAPACLIIKRQKNSHY